MVVLVAQCLDVTRSKSKARHNYAPTCTRATIDHAGISGKTRRIGALRDHDGRLARPPCRHHGFDYRRNGARRPARRLLPEPALARQARHGHPDHHEKSHRCEGTYPECDGRAEEELEVKPHSELNAILSEVD